jgi:hypothetical protein
MIARYRHAPFEETTSNRCLLYGTRNARKYRLDDVG